MPVVGRESDIEQPFSNSTHDFRFLKNVSSRTQHIENMKLSQGNGCTCPYLSMGMKAVGELILLVSLKSRIQHIAHDSLIMRGSQFVWKKGRAPTCDLKMNWSTRSHAHERSTSFLEVRFLRSHVDNRWVDSSSRATASSVFSAPIRFSWQNCRNCCCSNSRIKWFNA